MRGVTIEAAQRAIPSLLRELGVSLEFRHVPFANVTLGLFDELLHVACVSGCTVGVGYDHALLAGRCGVLRHVCRVEPSPRSDHVLMLDDATEEPPRPREVRWLHLEEAVQAAKDGFWLIGEHRGLTLPYAPAWPK